MRVAILRGHTVNEWEMQLYEPLNGKVDLTIFVPENNRFDVTNINIKKICMKHSREIIEAVFNISKAYERFRKNKHSKSDFFYHTLRRYLRGFDIVHVNDFTRAAYTAAALKQSLGYKLILSCWENVPYCNIFSDKTTFLKEHIINEIDYFLPYADEVEKALLLEGTSKDVMTRIYPGVDIDRFKPGLRDKEFANQLEIIGDGFTVLYVGQLVSWKGAYNLVYAGKILKGRKHPVQFVLVGSGAQKNTLKKLIRYCGLEQHFTFVDLVPYQEIEKVYHLADVFVLPSLPTMAWQEQFGMVLAEAMACGVPVVASNTGSIPEVVGDAGVLFTPGNFWELAKKLEYLINNPEVLNEFREKVRRRAVEHFDAEKNAEEVLKVYRAVCQ